MKELKTIRSLKKGTRFITYGKDDVKQIAIAGQKRGYYQRDIEIEGKDGTYSIPSYWKVEVIDKTSSLK